MTTTTATPAAGYVPGTPGARSSALRTALKMRKNPALLTGVTLLGGMLLLTVLTPLFSPYTVTQINQVPFSGPSAEHWLGTDNLARDNFTRLAAAARSALQISLAATVIAAAVGSAVGVLAGYYGGVTDTIIMRAVDVLLSIPAILLALVTRVIFGPGMWTLIISLAIIAAPGFARVMRAPVISLRERDFVTSAEISGVNRLRIASSHLLPNALTPLFVQFAATASSVVLMEAILSFLGQGILPPDPSAGRMIADSVRFMAREPLLILLPAAIIIVMTIAWNLVADGLQTVLSPRAGVLNIAANPRQAIAVRRRPATTATNPASAPRKETP